MELKRVDKIIKDYDGEQASLVMILQDIQEELNYLPEPALRRVSEKLNLPFSRVHTVATFYSSFSLKERGKHIIKICDGTACHLRGAPCLCDEIEKTLEITEGETSKDKEFTLEVVACLGACALAPVITIDNEYEGKMTAEKIKESLEQRKKTITKNK